MPAHHDHPTSCMQPGDDDHSNSPMMRLALVALALATSIYAQQVTDADVKCSACLIGAAAMAKAIEATDPRRTVDRGSRIEGSASGRQKIAYLRSESHITSLLESLCTEASLGVYGGHAQHINTKRCVRPESDSAARFECTFRHCVQSELNDHGTYRRFCLSGGTLFPRI